MNKIKNTFRAGFAIAAGLVAMYSCTDTWNDHYEATAKLDYDGTTMQALEEKASDFAKVVKAYGYERELASDNIYTVWAPANGSFELSDYLDANGNMYADSADVVKEFIKNHVARYALSLNGEDRLFSLMNEKKGTMTADGVFGGANIIQKNISCKNGVLHVIDGAAPYNYNLFELIYKQYREEDTPGKDTLSLYSFLYDPENNQDSLIENKSVSRGVDENGDKIWVDSFVMRNNTILKNVDAKLYEEDSAYIAILPSSKAWAERYKIAEKLLKFNPVEDDRTPGACDSLLRHYANHFAMSDLFYNINANEHRDDSLKSTLYGMPWYEHVYYSKMPKHMPEDKEINDILAKCGEPFMCSNGEGYLVDEYPMTEYEQFFKKIKVTANSRSINRDLDTKGKPMFTNNVTEQFITTSGTFTSNIIDSLGNVLDRKVTNYNYVDLVPSTKSVNPTVGFDVPNTLSGTYDLYLVTCPIWLNTQGAETIVDSMLDARPYRFYTYVFERDNEGKNIGEYPTSTDRLTNPADGTNVFETRGLAFGADGHLVINDTTYLGSYTFKNAYYGRNEEGVVIQLQTYVTSKQTEEYSREMLVSSIILKPRDSESDEEIVVPVAEEAKMRKGIKLTISNIRN